MTFGIYANIFGGILTFLVFFIIIISLGDPIRRFLKIYILNSILDSVICAILSTITISIFLYLGKFYSHTSIVFIILLGFICELFFIFSAHHTNNTSILFLKDPKRLKLFLYKYKRKIRFYFTYNKSNFIIWVFIIVYQVLFIILPAIVYPLPLENDMKHHSLILQLIVQENSVFPTWTPSAPILGNVFYQLGGHIYAAIGYELLLPFGIPIPTFINFWFRISFLMCFYAMIFFSAKLFPNIPNSRIYTAVNLLLTPSFFWITRWGGYSWILGLFVLIYIIKLCIQPLLTVKNNEMDHNPLINQILLLWMLSLLGLIHSNIIFYALLFCNIFLIFSLIKFPCIIKTYIPLLILIIVVDLGYFLLILAPHLLLQFLPLNIQQQLFYDSFSSQEAFVSIFDLLITNYFLGGLFSTIGILIFIYCRDFLSLLKSSFKTVDALSIILLWLGCLCISFYILQIDTLGIKTFIFYFPGANFVTKTWRILYFVFFMITMFSPIFWNFFVNTFDYYDLLSNSSIYFSQRINYILFVLHSIYDRIFDELFNRIRPILNIFKNKKQPLSLFPLFFLILIISFGFLSAYSLELPNNRAYSSYTLEAFQYIQNYVPPGSYFLNDVRGQWLPVVVNTMRISYPNDPLNLPSLYQLTFQTFITLFNNTHTTSKVNITKLFSNTQFKGKISYIFVSKYVFNDIYTYIDHKLVNLFSNMSILDLRAYNSLNLIYYNPEVAIYHVIW